MKVHRFSKRAFARDLSGMGAAATGGRWNFPGEHVIYASTSLPLAALEYLVHAIPQTVPGDVCYIEIEIPETASIQIVDVSTLPHDWDNYPDSLQTQNIGSAWIKSNGSLLLQVPSVILPGGINMVINPKHPEMSEVRIVKTGAWNQINRFFPRKKTPQFG